MRAHTPSDVSTKDDFSRFPSSSQDGVHAVNSACFPHTPPSSASPALSPCSGPSRGTSPSATTKPRAGLLHLRTKRKHTNLFASPSRDDARPCHLSSNSSNHNNKYSHSYTTVCFVFGSSSASTSTIHHTISTTTTAAAATTTITVVVNTNAIFFC